LISVLAHELLHSLVPVLVFAIIMGFDKSKLLL
jgi:hypothetical protein